jgi:hypothetical protein
MRSMVGLLSRLKLNCCASGRSLGSSRSGTCRGGDLLDDLAAQVATAQVDTYSAADRLVAGVTS